MLSNAGIFWPASSYPNLASFDAYANKDYESNSGAKIRNNLEEPDISCAAAMKADDENEFAGIEIEGIM